VARLAGAGAVGVVVSLAQEARNSRATAPARRTDPGRGCSIWFGVGKGRRNVSENSAMRGYKIYTFSIKLKNNLPLLFQRVDWLKNIFGYCKNLFLGQ
jgi:hypothetical protein